jgi:hypothetical protein
LFSRGHAIRHTLFVAVCWSSAWPAALGQSDAPSAVPSTTAEHVVARDWWPTKGTPSLESYVGENACGKCHSKESLSQVNTPMAQAGFRPGKNPENRTPAAGTVQSGSYRYRVSSDNLTSRLVVSAGQQSIAADITWIFGAGVHGQTYILETKNTLYESQVSHFAGLRGMDITPGHTQAEPGHLQNALGERFSAAAAAQCFACHTTASTTRGHFDPKHATPGITCEACHGPGLAHIVAANMGLTDQAKGLILNPHSLNPVDSIDFCGACHRTSMDVVKARTYGPINVRFQTYRLEKSRCWGDSGR